MALACGPGCRCVRSSRSPSCPLLHLLEHLGERTLDLERLLDLVAGDIGVLAVLEEARALMVTDVLHETGSVGFPVRREALEIVEGGVDASPLEEQDCILGVLV